MSGGLDAVCHLQKHGLDELIYGITLQRGEALAPQDYPTLGENSKLVQHLEAADEVK